MTLVSLRLCERTIIHQPFILMEYVLVAACRSKSVEACGHTGENISRHLDKVRLSPLILPVLVHEWVFLDHRDDVFLLVVPWAYKQGVPTFSGKPYHKAHYPLGIPKRSIWGLTTARRLPIDVTQPFQREYTGQIGRALGGDEPLRSGKPRVAYRGSF